MTAFIVLRGSGQYISNAEALINVGVRTTRKVYVRRRSYPANFLFQDVRKCLYATAAGEVTVKKNAGANKSPRQGIAAANENDPDQFGNMKDAFIEPSRLHKRLAASIKKEKPNTTLKNANKHTGLRTAKTINNSEEIDEGDVFGSTGLRPYTPVDSELEEDEGDKREEEYLSRKPCPWKEPRSFATQMKLLIGEKKLGEALALLKEMIEIDRVKPDAYVYNVLIGGCGRAGYTEMAFKLFKQMRERRLEPDGSTFTGLFNACANSPFPEDGLKRATNFYQKLTEKGIGLNAKTYHAAIKAFGRCGDLQTAFHLVDEMVTNGVGVTTETFNFLLMGCASDRTAGFLQAIRVFKTMRAKRLRPDTYSYNLLLRVTRDCGLGDSKVAETLLLGENAASSSDLKQLSSRAEHCTSETPSAALPFHQAQLPDLLSPNSMPGALIAFGTAHMPQERLLLLGGVAGLIYRMKRDNAPPELKTFTELLEVIPYEEKDETLLLEIMKEKRIRPDIDFFNVLIKRRNMRDDFESAKNVLNLIAQHSIHVDIATFGTLALGCCTWKNAKQLLHDMKVAGFRPNIQIMGALVHKACCSKDFWYLIDMLKIIRSEEIPASPKLVMELESFIVAIKNYILDKEKQGVRFPQDGHFIKSINTFRKYYSVWLKEMNIEPIEHPWEVYKECIK